jgi:hypothetical protein
MTVRELVETLALSVISAGDLEREVTGGYASDLLSCVMARARAGHVWVTLQGHPNVVAVASLLDLSAVVVTESVEADEQTLDRANAHGVTLLGTVDTTFTVVGQLSALGVQGA